MTERLTDEVEATFRRHIEAAPYAADLIKRIAFEIVPLFRRATPADDLRTALLREVLDCQQQHYGDGARLHIAMISLADRIRAALSQNGGAA